MGFKGGFSVSKELSSYHTNTIMKMLIISAFLFHFSLGSPIFGNWFGNEDVTEAPPRTFSAILDFFNNGSSTTTTPNTTTTTTKTKATTTTTTTTTTATTASATTTLATVYSPGFRSWELGNWFGHDETREAPPRTISAFLHHIHLNLHLTHSSTSTTSTTTSIITSTSTTTSEEAILITGGNGANGGLN